MAAGVALTDLKEYLGVTVSTWDDLIQSMADGVLGFMEKATGRYLGESASRVEILSGTGHSILWLPDTPTTFTSLEVRDASDVKTFTAYDAGDFEVDGRRVVRLGTGWPKGFRNLRANYEAGYSAADFPDELGEAQKVLVEALWGIRQAKTATSAKGGVQEEEIGDYRVKYAGLKSLAEVSMLSSGQSAAEFLAGWRVGMVLL